MTWHDSGMDLPADELQWRFETSGGPGGQHANRSSTRAILTFDVSASRVFDDETRSLIVERLGQPIIVIEVDETRSQWQNRQTAVDRLKERLEAAAAPPPPRRRKTRPRLAIRRRRLAEKRQHGEKKRLRQPPEGDQ
jgi:ribosome-associated protein